jgi:hypothetical protein
MRARSTFAHSRYRRPSGLPTSSARSAVAAFRARRSRGGPARRTNLFDVRVRPSWSGPTADGRRRLLRDGLGLSVRIREIFTNLGGFRPQPAGPVFQRATA